jgi:hypothetical protein
VIVSPYTPHVSPYPTRFHGGIWVRPEAGYPFVPEVQGVFMPHQMAGDPSLGESDTTSYAVALGAFVVGAGIGYYLSVRKNKP